MFNFYSGLPHIDLTLRMSLGMETVEVSKPTPEPPSKGVAKEGIITVLFRVKGEKTVACVMCVCVYIKRAICHDVLGVRCVQLCVMSM